MASLLPFIPLVAYGVWTGGDTAGLFLLILVIGFTRWGPQPSLYATMAWAALLMELWGTHLGNWAWYPDVGWTPLTALNPPLLCGVVYALGDLLVNLTVNRFTQTESTDKHPVH